MKKRRSLSSRFHKGKGNSKSKNKDTLFGPPESEKYAEIVKMDSVDDANKSVLQLIEEFKSAETTEKRYHIYHVADLAAKRANAELNRENLSDKAKLEFTEIGAIYRGFANASLEALHQKS